MPFRQNRRLWPGWPEPLDQQGRGGEPSLAFIVHELWPALDRLHVQGYGRAEGSFTERVRYALRDWRREHGLAWHDPISFVYRLHRHRTISVTLTHPQIYHRRLRGDGSKGFVLEGVVLSIDGLPPSHRNYIGEFALNRIVGQMPVHLLAAGEAKQ
jgi:hypothetical protein